MSLVDSANAIKLKQIVKNFNIFFAISIIYPAYEAVVSVPFQFRNQFNILLNQIFNNNHKYLRTRSISQIRSTTLNSTIHSFIRSFLKNTSLFENISDFFYILSRRPLSNDINSLVRDGFNVLKYQKRKLSNQKSKMKLLIYDDFVNIAAASVAFPAIENIS